MIKLLFVIPYFNNGHFIKYQYKSFKKFFTNCQFDIMVVDDSKVDTLNCFTGENSISMNKRECALYGLIYHKFPENLHRTKNTAWNRHRELLNHMVRQKHLFVHYDFLVIADADIFPIREFDVQKELENVDLAGCSHINKLPNSSNMMLYFHPHMFFINLNTVPNYHEINFEPSPIAKNCSDTGGGTYEFIQRNPKYKYKFFGGQCFNPKQQLSIPEDVKYYDTRDPITGLRNRFSFPPHSDCLIWDTIENEDLIWDGTFFDHFRFYHFGGGSSWGNHRGSWVDKKPSKEQLYSDKMKYLHLLFQKVEIL